MARINNTGFVWIVASALIYYCLARFGMALFALKPSNITLLWLPSGIGLIMCLRWGYRALPFIILASFAANFIGMSASSGLGPLMHLVIAATADGMAGIMAMHLFKYFLPNGLARINDLVPFGLWICLFPTAITSIILSVNLAVGGYISWDEIGGFIRMLILADSLGILLVYQIYHGWRDDPAIGQAEMYWLGGYALLMVVLLILSFTLLPGMIFFILPLLLVLSFKARLNGVATISSLVMIGIIAATAHNIGPFVATDPMDSHFRLMAFVFSGALTILGLALQSRQLVSAEMLHKSEELLRETQHIAGLGSLLWISQRGCGKARTCLMSCWG
jgi:integral membrane sensor domain MASE1